MTACASTPVYGPALAPGRAGFTETQIEANRFFVTYRAPNGAEETLLQDYALLRAADITLANGRDWFWVDRRTTDGAASAYRGPSFGVGVGGGSWGRRSGGGVSVGMNFPLGGGGGARATAATLEIRLGSGVKPDEANAYDARAVAASLRAQFGTPR
ncbi:hypothetical protein U91I_02876 [alpha proteobacterium U9-1i]|nr:hypothetical protein U91I_02876 [alpha proteobacterium U9-1i]